MTSEREAAIAKVDSDSAGNEAVAFTQSLIRFDTRNDGSGTATERPAADWVADRLREVGIESTIVESAPGRAILIADIAGSDPSLPTLLVHGHLDTVPANPSDWSVDPLGGEIKADRDGIECVWGRGAVDMKNMVAMALAAIRALTRQGIQPRRNVRFVLLPDEEAGGHIGADWVVEHRPDIFANIGFVISETGGFSDYVNGKRVYYVQVGEKGTQWFRLEAQGTQSHGSQINHDNAVVRIAEAAIRVAHYAWPVDLNPVTRALLNGLQTLDANDTENEAEDESDTSPETIQRLITSAGTTKPWVASSLRNTFNVSSIDAGSTVNIVPAKASALVDGRALPGQEDHLFQTLQSLAGPDITVSPIHRSNGYLIDPDSELFAGITSVLQSLDPEATVLPFLSSGGTDSKEVKRVSPKAQACGFIPLKVPEGFSYIAQFHGIDERVPIDALRFGEQALERFIATF
ncbi:M20/M25/M40 family metallo-hydrolase [Bifidobacterium felsineum]|uniref:M20/M25/M40 family metallo-hydrolase n=1 Tax=Bifidobacterium felsineum TaxID=2045440 RepID=UPI001BDC077C|nr:M20/M25/M40 family metallo-hydrolase [Bifidobacterium felsineum]MBT1164537.1 M20/M25/M40 family metallo-hydrolase [Bifidobacterium felsineum]